MESFVFLAHDLLNAAPLPMSTRSSVIAEGPRDALGSIEILQIRNIPF